MKKVLFVLSLIAASFAFIGCSDDDDKDEVITTTDLPANAQSFLGTHFSDLKVRLVTKDNDSYDVYFDNGLEVDFDLLGEWDDIDGNGQRLPDSVLELIPSGIISYVETNHSQFYITEINIERYGYEIELSNRVELKFNKDGGII